MVDHVIEIRKLSRSFGEKIALDAVNLCVPKGCVFGLVGENGAGKTTLLKHVLGLLSPKGGDVKVFGLNPVEDPVAVLKRIGYLSENRDMPDWMQISEFLRFTSAFFPNWSGEYAKELCGTFELEGGQRIGTLSRGQRARLGLLLALAHRPELLVLDEPSSGLDPMVRRDILTAIIRTVADEGRTVLFSSHLLDEVQRVADYVAILHDGQLVLSNSLDSILDSHHRFIVRFEQPLAATPDIPGAISCVGDGREWTILCNGQRNVIEQQLVQLHAVVVDRESPSLDEIFAARFGT